MIRVEEIGLRIGWKDGYFSVEYGFCLLDYDEFFGVFVNLLGWIWLDLCEWMLGCVVRGCVWEFVVVFFIVEGILEVILDRVLWVVVVVFGMLCFIYWYEDNNDGNEGVMVNFMKWWFKCEMGDDLGEELVGILWSIVLLYW